MKKNVVMKVLNMIAAVVVLTGCANQGAEDVSAIINDGSQVVETIGNGNADKIEKEVKNTEDAGTGSGINSTAAEKGSAALTAEEDAPETTAEPESTEEPEGAEKSVKESADADSAKESAETEKETTAPETGADKPETTAQPKATTEPETTAEPEPSVQSEPAQPAVTTQPEATPAQASAPAADNTTPACNHTFTIQTSTEVYSDCTGRALSVEACSKCGYVNRTIDDSGIVEVHAYGDPIWAVHPTCSTPGEQYHVCQKCGKEEDHYSTPIIEDNHNYVATSSAVVAKGCPNGQRLEDVTYVCSLCGDSYVWQEITVATEHYDDNGDYYCDCCGTQCGEIPEPEPVPAPEYGPDAVPESVPETEPAPAPEAAPESEPVPQSSESVPESVPESAPEQTADAEQQPVDNTQSGTG